MHSNLFQIFTRVYLNELSSRIGRRATLCDIPDQAINDWANAGIDFLWLLGVWQTGEKGRSVSQSQAEWRSGFKAALPDLTDQDIAGSPFAIQSYSVHRDFGDQASLIDFRSRLADHNIQLMLDFVPNHTAIDHPWAYEHPEYYVHGTDDDLQYEPQNYLRVETKNGSKIMAYGRDPYFSGWPDTLQLDYRSHALKLAMQNELLKISELCDGVRCDMAMLVLPQVFDQTWGNKVRIDSDAPANDESFWPVATRRVREVYPQFTFMAEVYWDMEWEVLHNGFDFAYDKRLYDRLRSGDATQVRGHLVADPSYQNKLVRFLENHDEPRAAATFGWLQHQAAAVISFLAPGMRFFYDGQFEGRQIHASMHLGRRPHENPDPPVQEFYQKLLTLLARPAFRKGNWRLLDCRSAWGDNPSHTNFITYWWTNEQQQMLVVVNYGDCHSQCYVPLPNGSIDFEHDATVFPDLVFADLVGPAVYHRDGNDLREHGLYLDLPPWGFHVFDVIGETHES